ncbi:MAG TPA: hypothetical protein DEB39_15955 [Planctomycetaceae bacterium]|nr:hypothetical protein [Planctomycetaceae bacterium]
MQRIIFGRIIVFGILVAGLFGRHAHEQQAEAQTPAQGRRLVQPSSQSGLNGVDRHGAGTNSGTVRQVAHTRAPKTADPRTELLANAAATNAAATNAIVSHATDPKPNPLRSGNVETRGAVRLVSGETSNPQADRGQALSLDKFPEAPSSESFLDAAGFEETSQPFPPVPASSAPSSSAPVASHAGGFAAQALEPPLSGESIFGADPFGDGPSHPSNETPAAQPVDKPAEKPAAPGLSVSRDASSQAQAYATISPFAVTPAVVPEEVDSPFGNSPALSQSVPSPVNTNPVETEPTFHNNNVRNNIGRNDTAHNNTAIDDTETLSRTPSENESPGPVREGSGIPGPKSIHGPQNAQLVLEKILPDEIQVDQQAVVKIAIRNTGKTTAEEVVLVDQVPQGTRLISTSPPASMSQATDLAWDLGSIDPGKEVVVEMCVVPLREGEIGSVARVMFASSASASTLVTRPMLKVEVRAPRETLIGETINLDIVLSNPGSGTANGVVLEEFVPEGLFHKDGKQLINKIGRLKPKETMKLTLPVQAVGAGKIANRLVVRADNNLSAEEKTVIDVLSPVLQLKIDGAKTRYLDRKAVYQLTVANPGTASASNVDLVCQLPTSMQFVSTNQSGLYESSTHSVHWALEELPAGEAGQIELVTLPVKSGDHKLKFSGAGQNGLKGEVLHDVAIDGLASVSFSVKCLSDLVEVGRDTTYEIEVLNRGTKASTNVVVGVQLSKGMNFVSAEGPVKYRADDGIVQFNPLGRIDPKTEKTYRVTARCLDDGDHRISVKLLSDDLQAPITKEESTRVIQ